MLVDEVVVGELGVQVSCERVGMCEGRRGGGGGIIYVRRYST